ncbi:MAG: hypothetical protein GF398_15840 [Chitinivibrionales bacterium]|nr:hypothetical protein [Chitinivibrionales bacterium]
MNRSILMALVALMLSRCSSTVSTTRHEHITFHRSSQLNHIDTGWRGRRGMVVMSGGFQSSVREPHVLVVQDSSQHTTSQLFGTETI